MSGSYDYRLVMLAFMVSMLTSLATLILATKIHRSKQASENYWLIASAITVGTGIWATHCIGMLAYKLPIHTALSPLLVFLAWIFSALAAGVSLKVATIKTLNSYQFIISTFAISTSLVLTPYIIIKSIVVTPHVEFNLILVMITMMMSVSAAIVMISTLNWLRNRKFEVSLTPNISSALFISSSLIIMQYCSMSSTIFANNSVSIISNTTLSTEMLALLIALGAVGLVLASFVSTLFYFNLDQGKLSLNINLNESNHNELTRLAMVDTLTQLPNRRYFQYHLEIATHRVSRSNHSLAIAFIDLDGFKRINDIFGHQTGDHLLIAVASRLSTAIRGCDMVARLGGDEFVALIDEVRSDEEIVPIVERIIKSLHKTFNINQHEINISASVGIAVAPRDGDMAKLMLRADTAMYRAKSDGKNQYRFYDSAIELAAEQLNIMQKDLRHALTKHEFKLYFQPKIDALTHQIVGLEAFIRWHHPSKGEISPNTFLAAAEHLGIANKIGDWVIEETCRTLHRLRTQSVHLPIAINLSAQQFRNKNLVKNILKTLKRFDLPTTCLMFEITEATAINNAELVESLLTDFQVADIKISMDDFGTGQSSLAYLQTVKVSELKLDRVFTKDILADRQSQAIVGAIVKLAHAIGLKVVAEGVETQEQFKLLIELGCDQLQGYYISHPVTEEQLGEVIWQISNRSLAQNNVIPFSVKQ
ncbi:MAG TPA: EAL domain-containing protein [Methylophilaceae bacterium]